MSSKSDALFGVIANITGHAADTIRPEMDLVADLGIDSPKALELLVEIEDRLGVEISDDEAESLDTVADVLGFVEKAEVS